MGQYLYNSLIMLLALLVPVASDAYNFSVDGIYYNKNGNEVEVTYKNYNTTPEYKGEMTIPESVTYDGETYTVTSIGSRAFYKCDSLTRLVMPNTVTSIGSQAFNSCTSLDSVYFSRNLITIGSSAFGCACLETP